jgi:uncharacterized membrane protein
MTGTFTRGLIAGAAGTTALSAATHLGAALRGRGDAREAPRTALGALAGIGNGLGGGVLASLARGAGIRFPGPVGAVVTGAASLAAADLTAAAPGVREPREWTAADVLPHLAYGATVQAVVSALPTPAERALPRQRARARLVGRSLLLGVAAGSRSALGISAPTLTAADTGVLKRLGALASVAGEMVVDKQPGTPPRTEAPSLQIRLASGAIGGGLLARRAGANAALPVTAGLAGAAAGSFGGLAWRRWADERMPDRQAALLEDAVALVLSLAACLPGRRRSTRVRLVRLPDPPPRPTPGRGR